MRALIYIVHHGRFSLFRRCCESLRGNLPTGVEVFVLLNGRHKEARDWLEEHRPAGFSWREVAEEPRTTARNRALAEHSADIVYFLDDDVILPTGALQNLLRIFADDPQLAVLGGPNLTPPQSSALEQ